MEEGLVCDKSSYNVSRIISSCDANDDDFGDLDFLLVFLGVVDLTAEEGVEDFVAVDRFIRPLRPAMV